MKTYKTSIGWRILTCVLTIPLLLFLLNTLFTLFWSDTPIDSITWMLASVITLPITVLVMGLYSVFKSRVIVGENKLYVKGIINRELAFEDIKGYRHMQQYIFIEPRSKEHKRMRIQALLERREEFAIWLTTRYPDLDMLAAQEERSEILDTDKFGENIEERIDKIQEVKKITRPLNRLAVATILCTAFLKSPILYVICMAMFVASMIVYKRYNDIIKFEVKVGNSYPSISLAMVSLTVGLVLLAMMSDTQVLDFNPIWVPLLILTAIFIGFFFWKNQEYTFEKKVEGVLNVILISALFMAFTAASMSLINRHFDTSEPEMYTVRVLKKNGACMRGAGTCPVVISGWKKQPNKQEIPIQPKYYRALNENEEATVLLKKGLLGIPWFRVVLSSKH